MSTTTKSLKQIRQKLGQIRSLLLTPGNPSEPLKNIVWNSTSITTLAENMGVIKRGRPEVSSVVTRLQSRKAVRFRDSVEIDRIRKANTKVLGQFDREISQMVPGDWVPEMRDLYNELLQLNQDLAPLGQILNHASTQLSAGKSPANSHAKRKQRSKGSLYRQAEKTNLPNDLSVATIPSSPGDDQPDLVIDPAWAGDPVGWALEQMSRKQRGTPVKVRRASEPRLPDPLFETDEIPAPFDLPRFGTGVRVTPRRVSSHATDPPITWRRMP